MPKSNVSIEGHFPKAKQKSKKSRLNSGRMNDTESGRRLAQLARQSSTFDRSWILGPKSIASRATGRISASSASRPVGSRNPSSPNGNSSPARVIHVVPSPSAAGAVKQANTSSTQATTCSGRRTIRYNHAPCAPHAFIAAHHRCAAACLTASNGS